MALSRTYSSNLFGLRAREVLLLGAVSLCLGTFLTSLYSTHSVWAMIGIAFSFFVLGHMILMAHRSVVFLELACFIACIMWVVAPWLAYTYVHPWPIFQMVIPVDVYMSYATPCCIALWITMHLPLRSTSSVIALRDRFLTLKERNLMNALIVFGLVIDQLTPYAPLTLRALFYMLGQLRFVGALSFLYSMSRGWKLRVLIVYLGLFLKTASGGVFYEFVLWMGYLLISLAYLKKWRWKLLLSLVAAFYLLMMLNDIKAEYRYEISASQNMSIVEKIKILTGLFWSRPDDEFHHEITAKRVVRWNQGWIIARVMATVPDRQPYARGETIKEAIIASILPRIFFPEKLMVASHEMFVTYTATQLSEETAMALGLAGETYANFGLVGGIIAVGVYGVLIGFIFAWFSRLAQNNSLIWAWVPFVLLVVFEAEWNVYDIVNHLTKSFIVFVLVISFIPELRTLFFGNVKKFIAGLSRTKVDS